MFKSTQLFKQSLTGKKFKQHNLAKFVRGDNEVNFQQLLIKYPTLLRGNVITKRNK